MTNSQAPQPVYADVRELRKWLNEEPNRPIDRHALARVLHALTAAETGEIANAPDTKDISAMCVPGYEVVARAKRIVDEQPRHSADSLREQLWREFKDAPDEEIERAVNDALGGQSAVAAIDELEVWVTNGCPGGPWKALAPLGVLRTHLKASA